MNFMDIYRKYPFMLLGRIVMCGIVTASLSLIKMDILILWFLYCRWLLWANFRCLPCPCPYTDDGVLRKNL